MKRFVVLSIPMLFVQFSCSGDDGPEFVEPDAPPTIDVCNPKTQTGCSAGEKCTWITDQEDPPIGHIGCVADGTVAIGEACTEAPVGAGDSCVKGSVCLSGVCKQICDTAGGQPTCDQNHACTQYADFFTMGTSTVAGVCDPSCDPLTQELKVGTNTAACGSANPLMPTSGCYGYDEFSCAPTGMTSWGLTDRQAPRTNASGNPYLNGCAPGFIPFFFEMTGSTKTLCSGFCSATEVTSATQGAESAAKGNPNAIGKLPTMAAKAGDARCEVGKKGSAGTSTCMFMWYYLEDDAGDLNDQFESGPLLDTLGICQATEFFRYDSNGDMTVDSNDENYPGCWELPARSAQTPGDDDDVSDWPWCVKRANWMPPAATARKSGPAAQMKSDFRIMKDAPMELVRHRLQ